MMTDESGLKLLVFAAKRSLSNSNLDRHPPEGGLPPSYKDAGPQKKEVRPSNRVQNLLKTFEDDEEERKNMECEFKEVTVTLTKQGVANENMTTVSSMKVKTRTVRH